MSDLDVRCIGCGKPPDEISEYAEAGESEAMTPLQYMQREEGTYNRENGHFACTSCYINMGMPSRPFPDRWVAP